MTFFKWLLLISVAFFFIPALIGGTSKDCKEEFRSIFKLTFQDVFTSATEQAIEGRPKLLSPPILCGDFNGDQVQDLVSFGGLGQLDSKTVSQIPIQYAAPLNMNGPARTWHLDPEIMERYTGEPALFFLLSKVDKKERSYSPKIVVKFANFTATDMVVGNKAPRVKYPHDTRWWRPQPRGQVLRFVDRKGNGTAIFWDGQLFRWIPWEP